MSYDALAESRKLLQGTPPGNVARLSRRVRLVPLAMDRDGDVAVTMFLRRGVSGAPLLEVNSLEVVEGSWRMLGGGGGPGDEATEPRPRMAELPTLAVSDGRGGTVRTGGGWVWWAELRVAQEVVSLRVDDRRIPVADHGCAVVVWTQRPPTVAALDESGAPLGPIPIHGVDPARVGFLD